MFINKNSWSLQLWADKTSDFGIMFSCSTGENNSPEEGYIEIYNLQHVPDKNSIPKDFTQYGDDSNIITCRKYIGMIEYEEMKHFAYVVLDLLDK